MTFENDTVCLFPNPRKALSGTQVAAIGNKFRSLGFKTVVTGRDYASPDLPFEDAVEAFRTCGLAAVLGGDGTMLRAARLACENPREGGLSIPLLGINFGTIGYMTELEFGELDLLDGIRNAPLESRMLTDASVLSPDGTETGPFIALNETVICREQAGKILRLTLLCDGHEVLNYRADGMIFSTPTGSSAYNLSAGGPIIDPKLNALSVCPLAAFTLAAVRPMVFSPDSVLEVKAGGNAVVTCDGKQIASLPEGGTLTVRRSETELRFVNLKNANFYEVLMRKLS